MESKPSEIGFYWWKKEPACVGELCYVRSLDQMYIRFLDGSSMTAHLHGFFYKAEVNYHDGYEDKVKYT